MSTLLNTLQQAVASIALPILTLDRRNTEKLGKTAGFLFASYLITTASAYNHGSMVLSLGHYRNILVLSCQDLSTGVMVTLIHPLVKGRFETLLGLHKKYGHIVRIARNHISVSDKDMIQQILVKDDLPKSPFYEAYQINGHPTLFDTTDVGFHKSRRRILSPAFSMRYIGSMEHLMRTATDNLYTTMKKMITDANTEGRKCAEIDLWIMLQHCAIDVIGLTAFGTEFNMITTGHHPLTKVIEDRLRSASFIALYPNISKWIPKSQHPYLVSFLKDVIQKRIDSGEERQDILQYLIGTVNCKSDDDRLNVDDIINEVVLFLIAGSETTSNSMGFAFIELLKHPHVYEKLRNEIDAIEMEEGQVIFNHSQVKTLPYLNAVIDETLRFHPANPGGMPRRAAADMILGGEHHIPKNTLVIAMCMAAQIHPDYWDEPEKFIPERWLDPVKSKERAMASLSFSAGSRNCIGKVFALQEMRVCIATLVRNFEFLPIESSMEDAKDRRQFVTLTIAKNSFMVQAALRQ